MKKLLLAVALAPFALGFSMANAQTEVTTDPVGFVKTTLQSGKLTPVGISLLKPAVVGGKVESVNGASVVLSGGQDLSAALDSGSSYYIEITSGPLAGDRIDVASGGSGGALTLDLGSAHNTLSDTGAISPETTLVVRPHLTLGDITEMVGADKLHTGNDIPDTDQILTYENGGFVVHAYFEGVWYDGQFNVVDDKVLAPGSGFLFRRQGAESVDLTPLGEVRSNDFVLPLHEGLQLVSFGFPVDRSPADYNMTTEFFTGANLDFSEGDQVLTYGDGGFVLHGLFSDNEWYDGQFNSVTDSNLFLADGAVLLRLKQADPDFRVLKPY